MESVVTAPPLSEVSLVLSRGPDVVGNISNELSEASLLATKYLFDRALHTEKRATEIINQLVETIHSLNRPQTRSMAQNGSGSKSATRPMERMQPTPLANLHIEGMGEQQIWNQLELRTGALCKILKNVVGERSVDVVDKLSEVDEEVGEDDEAGDDKMDLLEMDDMDEDELMEYEEDDSEETEEEEGGSSTSEDDFAEGPERMDMLRDPSSEPIDEFGLSNSGKSQFRKGHASRIIRHPELDDGFFSLSEFNAETEASEARASSKGRLSTYESEEESEEDVDLFASVEQDNNAFDEGDLEEGDSGHVFYNEFFHPPQQAPSRGEGAVAPRNSKVKFHEEVRVKEIKAKNRGRSAKDMKSILLSTLADEENLFDEGGGGDNGEGDEDDEDAHDDVSEDLAEASQSSNESDVREAIERFKDDLFDEGEEETASSLSAHEKRVAALAKQIAELEAENVGEKDWTLMGEATSKKRPHNSLLEEDLEFEQGQRPVSEVTVERITSLEEMITKRVLENRFDDVERKRPLDEKAFLPSRFLELNDAKSQQSLSQIYEGDYVTQKGGGTVNEKDSKLQKEHDALERLWDQISCKLDALCNAHFVPKQPIAKIETISNIASATLETALPTTKTSATTLAPEEIFKPGASEIKDRNEMTPAEKRALRSKERKTRKKARDRLDQAVDKFAHSRKQSSSAAAVKESKKSALQSIVRSGRGVTVVGNKLSSLDGKKKSQRVNVSGGGLKL